MEVKMDLGFLQLLYNIKGSSKEISLSISYIQFHCFTVSLKFQASYITGQWGEFTVKKECYLLNTFTVYINFLYIFCFSWKILYFYHFAFLFWWSVKFLHHKINHPGIGIDLGDKKLLFKAMKAMMDTISLFKDVLKHNTMHCNSLLFILSIKFCQI